LGRTADIPHVTFSPDRTNSRLSGFISKEAAKMLDSNHAVFNEGLKTIRPTSDTIGFKVGKGYFCVTTKYSEELIGKWNVELNQKGELQLYRD
jgi:hypothetical protein